MAVPLEDNAPDVLVEEPVPGILTEDCETGGVSGSDKENESNEKFNYLSGWRFITVALGLYFGVFLVNLELTATSTALVSITDDLQKFGETSWIVTAYLCTTLAGLVIWAKLSDILGRKYTILTSALIFMTFSGACGGAQTMEQLIVFRALQGVGASGFYAIMFVMMYELVPQQKYPLYATLVVVTVATSLALGPVFGGLLSQAGAWRWVFLLNVPAPAVAWLALFLAVPRDFPYQGLVDQARNRSLRSLDLLGAFLLISALVLLVSGLEEAVTLLEWNTMTTLFPLCVSILVWFAFFGSQYRNSRPQSQVDPLFPWRFLQNRVMVGLVLNSITIGAVNFAYIFLLPLRYQTAAGMSPLQAGIRLIPFAVSGAVGAALCAVVCKNHRVAPVYPGLVGGILQIIALAFLSRSDLYDADWPGLLGLEVVIGIGYGLCLGTTSLLNPAVVEKRDMAISSATLTQFRFLGGVLTVSIGTAVGNTRVRDAVEGILSPEQILGLFTSVQTTIASLPNDIQSLVRKQFVESFNLQINILLGFAVASVLTTLLFWKKPQITVP